MSSEFDDTYDPSPNGRRVVHGYSAVLHVYDFVCILMSPYVDIPHTPFHNTLTNT